MHHRIARRATYTDRSTQGPYRMRIARISRLLLLTLLFALAAACGSKGPLVMPSDEPAPVPAPSE